MTQRRGDERTGRDTEEERMVVVGRTDRRDCRDNSSVKRLSK